MKKQLYFFAVWTCCFWVLIIQGQGVAAAAQSRETDLLKARGIKVSSGAAPGYVADRECALCHNTIYRSYQDVGMARSFYRPRADRFIENFEAKPFYHEPSKRYYQIRRQGDRLIFKRYQQDDRGEPINVFTITIDWIMGSGNHSRVYFYQTEAGELYQLPLAWYSRSSTWDMAPGFDRAVHEGVTRPVRRECMFCHNAYPDVPEGSDAYGKPQLFPKELPEGTGCQRCHGPGANHVGTVFKGELDPEKIKATIVNPKRLSPSLRNDICFQCHMQPSVALFGVRRFDRADYSFRPGERLAGYLVQVDIREKGKEQEDRFEINHHPYRLLQSRCYKESQGALSCLTCHNPHRKVPEKERPAHYRKACLQCHKVEQCTRETHGAGAAEPGDCVSCHMPQKRPQDVVKVVMTDHLIQRPPANKEELLAPLKETEPIITDIMLQDPDQAPPGALGELYRILAVLRAGGGAAVVKRMETLLAQTKPEEPVPYLDLAKGQLHTRQYAEAEKNLRAILAKTPTLTQAKEWLGVALAGLKQMKQAIETFQDSLKTSENRAEAEFNLGRLLLGTGRIQEAVDHFHRALEIRPILAPAWYFLGNALVKLGKPEEAVPVYKKALEILPTYTNAYLALGRALLKTGHRDEAVRYWRHGVKVADKPEPIAKALAEDLTPGQN
jgi:Tfp pilus assembly protein PilF